MEVKEKVGEVVEKVEAAVNEVVDEAVELHNGFENDIDPWLEKWVKHPASGWIACGFGMALLTIGGVVWFVFGKLV